MVKNSPLLLNNSHLELSNGLFNDANLTAFRESSLDDRVMSDIKQALSKASSKDLFSLDLELATQADKSLSLLQYSSYHFVEALNLANVNNVLDLTQDCGGVAHFIADEVGSVDTIKMDIGVAELSAFRCVNKSNVTHLCEDIGKLTFPDAHYDLIVIGRLEDLKLSTSELNPLLAKLRNALTPSGCLVVDAANSQRLSKAVNAGQHSIPYLESYRMSNADGNVYELDRRTLRNSVLNQSFAKVDVHASFSAAGDYSNLFSENYLTSNVYALNHFHQLGYLDSPSVCEYLYFQRLVEEKRDLVDYASRFLVIAGSTSEAVSDLYNNDFTYFADSIRKPENRVRIERKRAANSVHRFKSPLGDQSDSVTLNGKLKQNLEPTTFHKGPLLVDRWLNALINDDELYLEEAGLEHVITEYSQWLSAYLENSVNQPLPYQLQPHNIVVHARSQEYLPIHREWLANDLPNGFVLFRALFWFAHTNRALFGPYFDKHSLHCIGDFIVKHHDDIQAVNQLNAFAELEQQLQNEILRDPIAGNVYAEIIQSSHQTLSDNNDVLKSLTDTVTKTHSELAVQGQRLQAYQAKIDNRDLRISDLRQHRDDLVTMVKKIEKRIDIERNVQGNLYAQIEHLEGRLHAQHIRNDELHSFLLARPSSRLKRFVSRWLNRLRGTTLIEEAPIPVAEHPDNLVEKRPFEELPEGEMVAMNTEDYELWIQENTLTEADIEQANVEIENMAYKPVFSILVPIYNTDPEYLLPMIRSVQNQIYPHWQLCLVDDSSPKTYLKRILEQEAIEDDRISIQLNDVNQGISITTNDALAIATGDYIALLDHDDEITIDALYENAKLINRSPQAGLIYSDEDKMELDGTRIEPYFKPDYSPDLLDTNNYICHFTVIKKKIIDQMGGFREGLDGSQDHDVILRAADAAEEIAHIPRILYHWRKIPGSTAVEYDSKGYAWDAGRKAIEDIHRKHEDGVRVEFGSLKGSYRIVREIIGNPLVSIVIPFKDKPALLDSCLKSILERTSYSNFEIVGVSNNSEQALTHQRMAFFADADPRIRFVEHNVPFNFSGICNYGVSQAKGDYIVLLNNDVEIITPDWIENMLQHAQRDNIGAVGCKLLFPDGRIQHAGIVAGMVGAAGHPHKLFPESHIGYHGRLHMVSNVSAVTGAMMMMSKTKFDEVGGLDADKLAVAYNDVDLCLKLIDKGYFNVFTPYAKAIHHESVSRGYEDTDEKMQRLLKEQRHFLDRWQSFLEKGDPFYNPNLSLKNERFSLNFKD